MNLVFKPLIFLNAFSENLYNEYVNGLNGIYTSPINSVNVAPKPFLNLYSPYCGWFSSTTPDTL